jgi:hypothetical protein
MEKPNIIKESATRRKERLSFSKRLSTKIVESKKSYKRNRFKKETAKAESENN